MTENQKRRITLMRQNHIGYAAIANELKLPLSTVKAFCRRNGLQAGDLAGDTQIENISASSPDIDLIRADSRVNSRKTPAGDEPCRSFVFYASFLRAKIICHTMVNKA